MLVIGWEVGLCAIGLEMSVRELLSIAFAIAGHNPHILLHPFSIIGLPSDGGGRPELGAEPSREMPLAPSQGTAGGRRVWLGQPHIVRAAGLKLVRLPASRGSKLERRGGLGCRGAAMRGEVEVALESNWLAACSRASSLPFWSRTC